MSARGQGPGAFLCALEQCDYWTYCESKRICIKADGKPKETDMTMRPTLEKITKRGLERQALWPARVTTETITPEQIREFYTNGSWPEKMVYCDMLKIIGDLAIRTIESIAEFERRSDRDKALARAEAGVVGFGVTAAFAGAYHDAAKYLRQRPETEKCETLGNESAKLVGGE